MTKGQREKLEKIRLMHRKLSDHYDIKDPELSEYHDGVAHGIMLAFDNNVSRHDSELRQLESILKYESIEGE